MGDLLKWGKRHGRHLATGLNVDIRHTRVKATAMASPSSHTTPHGPIDMDEAPPQDLLPPAPSRFSHMQATHAPGQQPAVADLGQGMKSVDFSHGDVDSFPPAPDAAEAVQAAMAAGAQWAYSPYRGHAEIRAVLAERLARLTERQIDPERELLISAGTQASLFLALSALIERGDDVAIAAPDYFAYRKIAQYLEARPVDVSLNYRDHNCPGKLDLEALRRAFAGGARVFVFSNPNNPTGVVYTRPHLEEICAVAAEFGGFVVVDQLYCRQIFDGRSYTHLRSLIAGAKNSVTLVGPSKTESLSGFRLGVAIGPGALLDRMESLQGLMTLRAPGYSQAALATWLSEPSGWLVERISAHQAIRDDLMAVIDASDLVTARRTEGGSYVFLHAPAIADQLDEFVDRLRSEAGVVVTHGGEFGDFSDAIRLNFSQDHDASLAAVGRLVQFLGKF
jgi:aspartate/methionine/tyrosine aminotransferase